MVALMLFGSFLALIAVSMILRGWVLSWLWAWFVVPFGVPEIGIAWAIGISALASMLARSVKVDDEKKREGEEAIKHFAKSLCLMVSLPLITLLIGWLAHSAMIS